MRGLAERAYFVVCRVLGSLLRSARYSTARIVDRDGRRRVLKRRSFYAPVLVRLSDSLMWLLDTGTRVLRQREWHERERQIYRSVHNESISIDGDGTLVLTCLPGQTLATLLEDDSSDAVCRRRAIEHAVLALAEFHQRGLTHGDAMAENVLVDLDRAIARWFDFETVHDERRPIAWRRADDLRALLTTCVVRVDHAVRAEVVRLIVGTYADRDVTRHLIASVDSVFRRSLTFHLAQAPLSFEACGQVMRELGELAGNYGE